jgi:hypothetical protein
MHSLGVFGTYLGYKVGSLKKKWRKYLKIFGTKLDLAYARHMCKLNSKSNKNFLFEKFRTKIACGGGFRAQIGTILQHPKVYCYLWSTLVQTIDKFPSDECVAISKRLDTRHCLFLTELNLCVSTWMCVWYWFIVFTVESVCQWVYVAFD